jgi:hypothetical protein
MVLTNSQFEDLLGLIRAMIRAEVVATTASERDIYFDDRVTNLTEQLRDSLVMPEPAPPPAEPEWEVVAHPVRMYGYAVRNKVTGRYHARMNGVAYFYSITSYAKKAAKELNA